MTDNTDINKPKTTLSFMFNTIPKTLKFIKNTPQNITSNERN